MNYSTANMRSAKMRIAFKSLNFKLMMEIFVDPNSPAG